jgi:hypothetical protein
MKTWGSGGTASLFLTSALDGGESGQLHVPTALSQGKSPRYPLDRKLGGLQSRSGRCGVEKNPLLLPEIEPRPSST